MDQSRALTALRQKKYQESLLQKTDAQLQTLQELVSLPPTLSHLSLPIVTIYDVQSKLC